MVASTSVTVNVGKATTSVTSAPAASDISVIGKLSASKLIGGSGSVAGTFAWKNPDTVITRSGSYEVTFMPSDSTDYSPCTCMVNITVIPILTISQSQVSLDLTGVTLPAGVTLISLGSAAQGSNSDTYSAVAKLIGQNQTLGNLRGLTVYDLKLLDQNGNPITNLTGKIKVKIPIPAGMGGNLKVLWYNPADGTLTDMNAVQENEYLIFETSHFSFYAIAQLGSTPPAASSPVQDPKTSSGNWSIFPLAVLGGGAVTGLVMIRRRVKYTVKKQSDAEDEI